MAFPGDGGFRRNLVFSGHPLHFGQHHLLWGRLKAVIQAANSSKNLPLFPAADGSWAVSPIIPIHVDS